MNESSNIIVCDIEQIDDIYSLRKLNVENKYVLNIMFKNDLNDLTPYCKLFSYYNALKIMNSTFAFENFYLVFWANSYTDYYRLERLFFAQAINNKNIYIKISSSDATEIPFAKSYLVDSEKTNNDELYLYIKINAIKAGSFGNIQPVFSVCGYEASNYLKGEINFSYLTDCNNNVSKEDINEIINEALINISENRIRNIDDNRYSELIFSGNNNLNTTSKVLYETEFYNVIANSNNIPISYSVVNTNGQLRLLKLITIHNIVRFLSQIAGEKGKALERNLKIDLVNEFFDKYGSIFVQLNLLTQYIWSVILMNIVEDKQQLVLSDNIREFDYSIIDKTLYDAIAYSEGIYQLIENSTIHTRFKNAILFIRNHNIVVQNNGSQEMEQIIENYKKRIELKNRFFPNGIKGIDKYKILEDVHNCLEIIVCDTAFSTANGKCAGMVNTFINNNPDELEEIAEGEKGVDYIFNLTLKNGNESKHYGVQLFEKNVLLNNGMFVLSTPHVINGNAYVEEYISCYVNNEKIQYNPQVYMNSDKRTYFTCYNVLLPLGYKWDEINKKDFSALDGSSRWLNESSAFKSYPEYQIIEMKSDSIKNILNKSFFSSIDEKDKIINKLKKHIENEIKLTEVHSNSIVVLRANGLSYQQIELLAKGIFGYAYNHRKDSQTLIAIYFHSEYLINEFVRFFSVFYGKKRTIKELNNLQIALLLQNEKTNNVPMVGLVIAGNNIEEAYNTAITYSYSNSNISVRFVDACKYLTRIIKTDKRYTKTNYVPILPFDLFLKDGDYSVFLQNIKNDIEKHDIRDEEYGCLIDNVHIRIGSKIHLSQFFEAELIFHNSNIINKFAYLIAISIQEELRQNAILDANNIMIVGYESYSSLLIQEIVRLLKNNNPEKQINYCIYSVNEQGKETVSYSPEVMENEHPEELIINSLYFTVMPINTTFTTIYKMQNIIRRNAISIFDTSIINTFNNKHNEATNQLNIIDFVGHYSLIVVTQKPDKNNETPIQNKYWYYRTNNSKLAHRSIVLCKENNTNKNQKEVRVSTYITVDTNWFESPKTIENMRLANTLGYPTEPLIYVDKTSTIPKALFKLNGTYLDGPDTYFKYNSIRKSYDNDDEDKIDKLFDCLIYSHVYKRDNHFQYYIDKNKYCEIQKESIIKWLRQTENCIRDGNFNVVISPLHNPDSIFLKLVLDYGFSHNFRLIHMPIYETNQTELLSKFSYIAQQYKEIAKHNSAAKLNFYFVDNSIVTGKTVERSLSLVRSLMSECGINEIVPIKFEKIFTLINRSRPHTISEFVCDSHKDIRSFLFLHVPNFNTHNNNCPTCNIVKQYERLVKRSSTNCMSNEYLRLAKKHRIKSIKEYEQWLNDCIINSESYYKWIKQWLYKYIHFFKDGQSEICIDKSDKKLVTDLYTTVLKKEKDKYDETYSNFSSTDSLNNNHNMYDSHLSIFNYSDVVQKNAIYIFKKYIQSAKNLLRLKTTHNFFNILNSVDDSSDCEKLILQLMLDDIVNVDSWIIVMEKYISYIKILSRPILSQFYHIRIAVNRIFENLLYLLLGSENETNIHPHFHDKTIFQQYDTIAKYINGEKVIIGNKTYIVSLPLHIVQYQLVLCLARRLTDLNSNVFLDKKNIETILTKWWELSNSFREYSKTDPVYYLMNTFPNENTLLFNISKLIKWASMSSEENAGNFLVQDLNEQLNKYLKE